MILKQNFTKVDAYVYEIPRTFRADMRVPGRLYADDAILEAALGDRSLEQLVNTTTLPGVVQYTLAMPDVHQGYGPPIGGVIAVDAVEGVVSPGATGYDINCGVRLLRSSIEAEAIRPHLDALVNALFAAIPSGVGRGGDLRLSDHEMAGVLEEGARWAVHRGYGTPEDLEVTEEHGSMAGARAEAVSVSARSRGRDQLGTLGSGNHFIEVGEVTEIFDAGVANTFGLFPGQLVVWIHSGSRGLGHQVCTDYVKRLQQSVRDYGIVLPDRELVCAPATSPEGVEYFAAMAAAANFAWANRQLMAHHVREVFARSLAGVVTDRALPMVYDVAHNIIKREQYAIDGARREVLVHRKGATRAFGPDNPAVPRAYRAVGQPVLVPGDMGTASFVLVGTARAEAESFGSSCHGAGRAMSRSAAIKQVRGEDLQARLRAQGIHVRGGSWEGLAEEAPEAYKDIDRVVHVIHHAGLARKVARTVPLGVIKG